MFMHRRRRTVSLTVALAAALSTAACTPSDTGTASSTAGTSSADGSTSAASTSPASTSPGVYGAPVDPSATDPTGVATDPPARSTGRDNGGGEVSVLLTYSGWNASAAQVEVDGYVPGVAEDGGTCLLTLTRGGTTVTASVPGTENVADTDCGGAAVPGSKLSQGSWTAVLSYDSAATHGASSPVEVQVP
jgi:hypothetical protein